MITDNTPPLVESIASGYTRFTDELKKRILVLDGGMGTMIQGYHLSEADFRGARFAESSQLLKGNNDLLSLTARDIIKEIHLKYVEAGADIFTTNTFNANAISMADYGMVSLVREMNIASAQLAREVADQYMTEHPERTVFVAGSLGPTNKTASMSPDVNNPAFREVNYKDLFTTYHEQVEALVEGGVDLILFETTFDTLNVKAGLDAALQVQQEKGCQLPIMLSLTLSGRGGRTFSGQTLAAFLSSISHVPIVSIGLNCSFGASDMKVYLKELSDIAPYYVSAYPNAGLPNSFGQYDETPEIMAGNIQAYIDEGLVNIIGGCCGTTPEHIAKYPPLLKEITPRVPPEKSGVLTLSGFEHLEIKPENNFVNVGERCNVAGSRKFLRLVKEKKYDEALSIARKQVDDGAQVIDVNMDDGLLDAVEEVKVFLNLIASEPDIARVPLMIDSSKWEVIEQGLMCVQGKSIVNSISLKEGEELFLQRAARVRQLGAAVIVMAFDEVGQADTYERKIAVCERAYRLLVDKLDFPPEDIIFDPNVLAIATGMQEHNGYGLDFIRAVRWIKKELKGAKISGGVSNLSFSFRGNNYIREAIHSVFLYYAIKEGMDMGIVNPSTTVLYDDIEPSFRLLLEDVILARRPEAAEELITYAEEHSNVATVEEEVKKEVWREELLEERLEYALMKGLDTYLEEDLHEALEKYEKAVMIIDGPLMSGMNRVGQLFGEGKMFLPQVVKTARTMKKAVAILQPAITREKADGGGSKAGKVVFATVKGDVHDIGKNIVSIVLNCNNYDVVDLGVMVPAETIIEAVKREKPDLLCLSGLITPSLEEMVNVTDEMQKAGLRIPIMVGGATTSRLHTALKIAPHYDYPVIHVVDASQNPLIAAKLLNPSTRDAYVDSLEADYERLRQSIGSKKQTLLSLSEARKKRLVIDFSSYLPPVPAKKGVHQVSFSLEELVPYLNWIFFFQTWRMNGRYKSLAELHDCRGCKETWLAKQPDRDREKAAEAIRLFDDAQKMLKRMHLMTSNIVSALYGFFPSASDGDNLVIGDVTFPLLRQQQANEATACLSLSDFVMPVTEKRTDYVGLFAVTAGVGLEALKRTLEEDGDTYQLMLFQTLSDRLAEAAAEYLHKRVRLDYWGYASDEDLTVDQMFKSNYQGIRPAVGYPSLPDQELIFQLDKLLDIKSIGIQLTENGAMYPTATAAGLYFAHPQSRYFMIGKISEEQLADYAERRQESTTHMKKFLMHNLSYHE